MLNDKPVVLLGVGQRCGSTWLYNYVRVHNRKWRYCSMIPQEFFGPRVPTPIPNKIAFMNTARENGIHLNVSYFSFHVENIFKHDKNWFNDYYKNFTLVKLNRNPLDRILSGLFAENVLQPNNLPWNYNSENIYRIEHLKNNYVSLSEDTIRDYIQKAINQQICFNSISHPDIFNLDYENLTMEYLNDTFGTLEMFGRINSPVKFNINYREVFKDNMNLIESIYKEIYDI